MPIDFRKLARDQERAEEQSRECSGAAPDRERTKVEQDIDDFLRSLGERNASRNTVLAYTKDLRGFVEYVSGETDWANIDHVRIRGFLSHLYERGLSKTSVARTLAALRSG